MASLHLSFKNAKLNALNTLLGSGAKFQVWDAGYTTKLVEWVWTGSMFATSTAGVLNFNNPDVDPVNPVIAGPTSYIADKCRIVDSSGVIVYNDITVGVEAILTNTTIVAGQSVDLVSFSITEL